MSDTANETETSVFASAKPVSQTDLVDGETAGTTAETKTETPETSKKASTTKAQPATGVPAWHLSLTLGAVMLLIGGVLLWMQSPLLAVIVIGSLLGLAGLSLIAWHFGGGETGRARRAQRSQNRSQNGAGGNSTSSRGLNPFSRRNRKTGPNGDQSQSRSQRRSQSQDPGTTRRDRARGNETGKRDRSHQGPKSQSHGPKGTPPKSQSNGPAAPHGPKGAPPRGAANSNGTRQQPPGRGRQNQPNALGGPSGSPTGPRRIYAAGPVCGPDGRPNTDKPTPPVKPTAAPTTKEVPPVKTTPATPVDAPVVPPPRKSLEGTTKAAEPLWPNVDLDHYPPVTAGKLPRITIPRKAMKLGPVYHHKNGPQWPTNDVDTQRSTAMATPDLLTRAERERHFTHSAATMTKLATDKTVDAHRFIALAGELDGMDDPEAQRVREEHLIAAAKAAHDAQVREHMATIYGNLVNPN